MALPLPPPDLDRTDSDDWHNITDAKQRKKVQDKLAQRARRTLSTPCLLLLPLCIDGRVISSRVAFRGGSVAISCTLVLGLLAVPDPPVLLDSILPIIGVVY
jgi:hypothetical protein